MNATVAQHHERGQAVRGRLLQLPFTQGFKTTYAVLRPGTKPSCS
jgi:hypothetical protein